MGKTWFVIAGILTSVGSLLLSHVPIQAIAGSPAPWTVRASVTNDGQQADGSSERPVISADGRFVVFGSGARNLTSDSDPNAPSGIFLRDMVSNTTTLVNITSTGVESLGSGYPCGVTPEGRYIVFQSPATDLVAGATSGSWNVYVRDIQAETTTLVSIGPDGSPLTSESDCFVEPISSDGRSVVFEAWDESSNGWIVYVRDLQAESTAAVDLTPEGAIQTSSFDAFSAPAISPDGSHVVFVSDATGLIAGGTNGMPQIFERDLLDATTTLISQSSAGVEGNGASSRPATSLDGNSVVFESEAANLVVPDEAPSVGDIFVRDVSAGSTHLVDLSTSGVQAVYGPPNEPVSISSGGRYVVFTSAASTLIPHVPSWNGVSGHVYVRDLKTGVTTLLDIAAGGSQCSPNSTTSTAAMISSDGSHVVFQSEASNLIGGDTNGQEDVFVRDAVAPVVAPNAQIAMSGRGPYAGRVICDKVGNEQTQTGRIRRDQTRSFFARLENDGTLADSFIVTGPGSSQRFAIHYYLGGSDVTSQVTGHGTVIDHLPSGTSRSIRILVRVRAGATPGDSRSWLVTMTSEADPSRADAVKARVVFH